MLIVSGNLSWLNWLTIVLAFPCFTIDGSRGSASAPSPLRGRSGAAAAPGVDVMAALRPCSSVRSASAPVLNMISPRPDDELSFEPLIS